MKKKRQEIEESGRQTRLFSKCLEWQQAPLTFLYIYNKDVWGFFFLSDLPVPTSYVIFRIFSAKPNELVSNYESLLLSFQWHTIQISLTLLLSFSFFLTFGRIHYLINTYIYHPRMSSVTFIMISFLRKDSLDSLNTAQDVITYFFRALKTLPFIAIENDITAR